MTFKESDLLKIEASGSEDVDIKPAVCLVCGRASNTGHHYGVTACLGCKTFFRRVVLQGGSPRCKYEGRCALQKGGVTKRICRCCRFSKCKEIGMKEGALHPCRDLIGRRHHSQSDSVSSEESPGSATGNEPQLSPTCEDAVSFLRGLRDSDCNIRRDGAGPHGTAPDDDSLFYSPTLSPCSFALNCDLSSSLRRDVTRLRQWAQGLPCFNQLTLNTRRFLLHRFCLVFSVMENGLFSSRMPPSDNMWFLHDGTCLLRTFDDIPPEIREQLTEKTQQEQLLLFPLTNLLLDEVGGPLRRLMPSPEEIAALKIVMLMRPTILRESESVSISTEEDRHILTDIRNRVLLGLHSLYVSMGVEHPERRLSEVLMLCGGLEVCAAQGLEHMHLLRFFDLCSFDADSERMIFGSQQSLEA